MKRAPLRSAALIRLDKGAAPPYDPPFFSSPLWVNTFLGYIWKEEENNNDES